MTVSVTLNLDDTAIGVLDRLAASSGSTREALVSLALEAYAEEQKWQIEKIQAAIKAANEGRFASDEDVRRVRTKFALPI